MYTFRTSDRTTGDTWARATRTGEKLVDVTVEQVASIEDPDADSLRYEWAVQSGFGTPKQWWDAIEDVHGSPDTGYVYRVETRGVERDDVAEALFETKTERQTFRITLDDERAFEVTTDDFEYESVDEYGEGFLQFTVEFSEPPAVDLGDEQELTKLGEIGVVETEDGWGTPMLHATVEHVEDGEFLRWEYPVIGTIATIQEVIE
ncbi:hypothetical protein [Halorubrum aethiopicum]|uniref:hypothetical protein n=1 Tax=Halorubrum aethiopicum TaxID=1758255 RepID=UPI0018E2DB2D|nr:hypothetical protein [Halorubrum aethiopicum]